MGLVRRRMRGPETPAFPIPVQIAVGVLVLWLPLVVLSLIDGSLTGTRVQQPFLHDVVPNVRFLLAVPLLLLADIPIDAAARTAIHYLETSGVIPDGDLPRFRKLLSGVRRARDSAWPDVVMVVIAYAITWAYNPGYGGAATDFGATSWLWFVEDGEAALSAAGWWYLLVSAPMFQVILYRWLWRFLIWAAFLFGLARIPLALRPVHPDLAGGLGYLGTSQQSFIVVFLAFSTVAASTVAHDVISEGARFVDARLEITIFVVIMTAIVYLPLTFFTARLFVARRTALSDYGALGYRLSGAFKDKWSGRDDARVGAELQASADPSAVADYTAAFDNVQSTRLIPATLRSIIVSAGILLIPFLPLVFTEFSLQELFNRIASSLV